MGRPSQLTFQGRSTTVLTSEGLQGRRGRGQACPKPDPTGLGSAGRQGGACAGVGGCGAAPDPNLTVTPSYKAEWQVVQAGQNQVWYLPRQRPFLSPPCPLSGWLFHGASSVTCISPVVPRVAWGHLRPVLGAVPGRGFGDCPCMSCVPRHRCLQCAGSVRGGDRGLHHVPHPQPVPQDHLAAPGAAGGHARPERRADPRSGFWSRQDPWGDLGHHRTRCVSLCPRPLRGSADSEATACLPQDSCPSRGRHGAEGLCHRSCAGPSAPGASGMGHTHRRHTGAHRVPCTLSHTGSLCPPHFLRGSG